jgi:hypothetical protein
MARNDANIHVKSLERAKNLSIDSNKNRYQKSSMDRLLEI